MIISHSKKFIFIHNYKVAGTSVRDALNPYNNKTFLNSSFSDKVKFIQGTYPKIYAGRFAHHIKANELKSKISPAVFNEYYKFGFVRNPWDRQVSLYKFMLKRKSHHQHDLIKSLKDFEEYIDWRVHNDLHLQKEFFYEGDTCLMDFIGKMENLESDFTKICQQIGVETELTHLNSSRNQDDKFISYYTAKSIELVNEAFREDIELFDYKKPVLKAV